MKHESEVRNGGGLRQYSPYSFDYSHSHWKGATFKRLNIFFSFYFILKFPYKLLSFSFYYFFSFKDKPISLGPRCFNRKVIRDNLSVFFFYKKKSRYFSIYIIWKLFIFLYIKIQFDIYTLIFKLRETDNNKDLEDIFGLIFNSNSEGISKDETSSANQIYYRTLRCIITWKRFLNQKSWKSRKF